ncbi:MAG: ABC transporter permease [Bacteroidales bacterium]|nr:ABC transporter permease [Bacteroidales bacterium]
MISINYFIRTNLRNLIYNKKFAFINIIGLSIGVTVSLLILLYVNYETSFDSFNPKAKNIYRVITENKQDGSLHPSTPLALSDVLKKDYPEANKVISMLSTWDVVKVNRERFDNLRGAIVEKTFSNFLIFLS